MKTIRKILVTIVMVVVVFASGFLSGCMTVKGLASDVEELSGAINRGLQPAEENRRQVQLDRAAQLVIENRKTVTAQ
jgi:predicted small secreted protein